MALLLRNKKEIRVPNQKAEVIREEVIFSLRSFNHHLYEHFQANGESVGAMVIAGTTTSGLELTLWSSSFL